MIILSTVEAAMSAATARDTRATTAVEAAVSAAINSISQAERQPLQRKIPQATRLPLQSLGAPRARQEQFQSPPLMPAQRKNTEQPTRDRRGFRNDHPIYLNVID